MTGGARALEREPRRGRHRRGSGGATWTPVVPGKLVAARPVPVPSEPIAYAWPETPPTGLRKFNLGTIPASVTPPSTWRRAAWFAVGTATFVVLALGFAAFRLVGTPRRTQVIDALPGQPSQQLLITDLPNGAEGGGSTSSTTRPTTPPRTTTTRPGATKSTPKRTLRPGDGQPGSAPDREPPARPNPVQPTTAP